MSDTQVSPTPTISPDESRLAAFRLMQIGALTATIRELQAELPQLRADYSHALERIELLQETLTRRTDALHLAEAEIARLNTRLERVGAQ